MSHSGVRLPFKRLFAAKFLYKSFAIDFKFKGFILAHKLRTMWFAVEVQYNDAD
jgi:hypothetical protein